ncbi:MAG: NADH-quinone oxidoreductase subunit J [Gemmatimonadales bacterium]|nr:NADH-quinone oxidoreductase subunit J [Gemmatimonadales bacterium]
MVQFVFYTLAVLAVSSALLCITRKSPVPAALWLVSTMFALAGIYVLLNAQFIAAMQVLVYAGAIMVLFLFVIMLLNLGRGEESDLKKGPIVGVAALLGVVLIAALVAVRGTSAASLAAALGTVPGASGPAAALPGAAEVHAVESFTNAVAAVASPMFRTYLVPFELTSVLLLAAAVGAVVLAKRKL